MHQGRGYVASCTSPLSLSSDFLHVSGGEDRGVRRQNIESYDFNAGPNMNQRVMLISRKLMIFLNRKVDTRAGRGGAE
jgi:hypothetical protein